MLYSEKENYLQAIDEYLAILEQDGKNSAIYKNLAQTYYHLDNFEAAKEAYTKALAVYPDDIGILKDLADIYVELEEYNEALILLEKLTNLESDNKILCDIQNTLAKVYIALSKDKEALEELNCVLSYDPKNVEAIGILVDFYILKKDYENAIKYTEEIKTYIPKSPFGYKKAGEANEALGKAYDSHYNFGIYHDLKGEKQLAIDEFTLALEHSPKNIEVMHKIAKLYEEISEVYIAVEYYQRAYGTDNSDVFALERIAELHTKEKNYEQAIEALNETIKNNPKDKEAVYKLGSSYENIKNFDLALENYKKYLEINPNGLKSKDAKLKIQNIEAKLNGEEDEGFINKIIRLFSKK